MGQKNTQSVRRVRQFGFCFCPSECELRGKGARLTFKLACCPNLPSELNSQSGMGNAPPAEGSINKQGTTRTGNWLTHGQTRNKSCLSLQVMKTDGQTPLTRHGSIYKQKQKVFPKRIISSTDGDRAFHFFLSFFLFFAVSLPEPGHQVCNFPTLQNV